MENIRRIDWGLIAAAVDFYVDRGFVYTEVPWLVGDVYNAADRPGLVDLSLNIDLGYGVHPVASAEQGFLQLRPLPGMYVGCSPCFRHEQEYRVGRQPWFMKVELFATGNRMNELLDTATEFLSSILDVEQRCVDAPTPIDIAQCIDIVEAKSEIELGSYGVRSWNDIVWTYGTGLAEPRTSALALTSSTI